MRPLGPVPETFVISTPRRSAAFLAANGIVGDVSFFGSCSAEIGLGLSCLVSAGGAAMTSSDVILPPGPVPCMTLRSIPFSRATRLALGDAMILPTAPASVPFCWAKELTSSEVILPPGPEPETSLISTVSS